MKTFAPECTLPETGPAFIQQPNVRSTMDIIWSSLVIMVLCTWSILHLNVPPQLKPLPPPKNVWERFRRSFFISWYRAKPKIRWMAFTMLFPEWPLGVAIKTLASGLKHTQEFNAFQETEKLGDEAEWTLTHSMYANMGGFVVRFPTTEDLGQPSIEETSDRIGTWLDKLRVYSEVGYRHLGPFDWDPHRKHFALAKANIGFLGLDEQNVSDGEARALSGSVWALNAPQLLEARRCGIIRQLSAITEDEINDKNKGDMLIKLLAILQVVWLNIQLIIRAIEGRQSSQLEITALALAACAFATYVLLLWQPKDIYTPAVLLAQRSPSQEEFDKLVKLTSKGGFFSRKSYTVKNFTNPDAGEGKIEEGLDWYGTAIGLFIFGCIHLVAWNFHFPSAVEQLLWRISSLLVVCLPLALMVAFFFYIKAASGSWQEGVALIFLLLILVVFALARLFLLVEAFRSTYYLPPSSYVATWANNIPHFG
ncbi:hypothetical protein OQA88_7409 [Cercophora sp. LCS_1]